MSSVLKRLREVGEMRRLGEKSRDRHRRLKEVFTDWPAGFRAELARRASKHPAYKKEIMALDQDGVRWEDVVDVLARARKKKK